MMQLSLICKGFWRVLVWEIKLNRIFRQKNFLASFALCKCWSARMEQNAWNSLHEKKQHWLNDFSCFEFQCLTQWKNFGRLVKIEFHPRNIDAYYLAAISIVTSSSFPSHDSNNYDSNTMKRALQLHKCMLIYFTYVLMLKCREREMYMRLVIKLANKWYLSKNMATFCWVA